MGLSVVSSSPKPACTAATPGAQAPNAGSARMAEQLTTESVALKAGFVGVTWACACEAALSGPRVWDAPRRPGGARQGEGPSGDGGQTGAHLLGPQRPPRHTARHDEEEADEGTGAIGIAGVGNEGGDEQRYSDEDGQYAPPTRRAGGRPAT